jgi:hypothetical protein
MAGGILSSSVLLTGNFGLVKVVDCRRGTYQKRDADDQPVVDDEGNPVLVEKKSFEIEIEFSGAKLVGYKIPDTDRRVKGLQTIESLVEYPVGTTGELVLAINPAGKFGIEIKVLRLGDGSKNPVKTEVKHGKA